MQILSIRGENIASLAKPFEIRLDTAPLASAGLFAITGETGAGKSSLLDAMCLALYGNCPRLSGDGTSERVAEIGQELSSTDTRMVLRRGAASGFAEVTFRSPDGETYTAGWQARRARDRIDGRLQTIERSLARQSDGQVLETQVSRVNDRVAELTGLTYDEFRRTVLLAQGDFAAFLDARTQERAAILEKVTGTGIYRDISRRVFERNREVAAELATLETRRGEHQLLTPEDRDEIAGTIAAQRLAQTAAMNALEVVRKDLARYAAAETAEANLARAKGRVEAARAGIAELADDRRWLADWDRAQALRGEVRELGEAIRALEDARVEHSRIAADHAVQKERIVAAKARFAAAKTARDEAEQVFKAFAPLWDQAAALDERTAHAAEEHAKAVTALAGLRRVEADRQRALDTLVAQEAAYKQTITTAERTLTAVEGHAALLANWGVIEERLGERIDQARLAMTSASDAERMAASIAADRAKRQAFEAEVGTASGEIESARKAQEAIRDERLRLTETAPGARLERLAQTEADLRNLRNAAGDVRRADEAFAEAQARRAAAERMQSEQGQALIDARAAEATASDVIQTMRQPAEAAAAAASREAEHLRQHLAHGTPCPVCGATTHPVMADGEIARIADDLRQRITEAQARRDAAEASATQAMVRIEAAADAIKTETANELVLKARILAAEAGYARARTPLETSPLGDELPDTPRAEEARFDALQSRIARWRRALETDRDRLAELDLQHRGADTAIEAAKAKITEREGAIRDIGARIATRETEIARLDQVKEAAQTAVARIDRTLAPLLAPTGIRADTFGPDATLAPLREKVSALIEARDLIETTRKSLGEHSPMLAEARAKLSGAASARKEAEATETDWGGRLDQLRTARAALLGGEATGAHRTRHNDARTAAQKTFDSAQETLSTSISSEAALASALEAAARAQTGATDRVTAARTALIAECGAVGIEEAALVALHAAEPAAVEERRRALKEADTELAAAEGAAQERDQECTSLKAAGLPDTPKVDLETAKATLEAEAQTRGETLGALSQQLDADARVETQS
jgi:exonuclease SbcC